MTRTVVATFVSVSCVSIAAATTGVDRLFAFWLRGAAITEYRIAFAVALVIALVALFGLRPRLIAPTSVVGWLMLLAVGAITGLIVQVSGYFVCTIIFRQDGAQALAHTIERFGLDAMIPALLSGGWLVGAFAAELAGAIRRALTRPPVDRPAS